MMQNGISPIARILLSPWQRRFNQGKFGLFLILGLCALPTICALAALALSTRFAMSAHTFRGVAFLAWVGPMLLGPLGWWMLVSAVLQQNHPTFARLVPRHALRLRTALLLAWALLSLAAAAGPGLCVGAPLASGLVMATVLMWFAAMLRWPIVGAAAGIFLPLGNGGRDALFAGVRSTWQHDASLLAAAVVAVGVWLLWVMVESGGARHLATFEKRRLRVDLMSGGRWSQAGMSRTSAELPDWLDTLLKGSLYNWWLGRLLSRSGSSVKARLLAGLGPATHWTSRVTLALVMPLAIGGPFALLAAVSGREFRQHVLPFMPSVLTLGILVAFCASTLLATAQLLRSQREQALLSLLPGVPRGADLNRWLGWRMSVNFVVVLLYAFALCWAASGLFDADELAGDLMPAFALALLPQVAWQWRRWAHLAPPSGGSALAIFFGSIVLGIAVLVVHRVDGVGYPAIGAVSTAVPLLYCAWRWWRMGAEPSALPMGRLA